MAYPKLMNIAALATALLLGLATTKKVEACRCLPVGLYEGFEAADVALHGTALFRSAEDTLNNVRYTLDVTTLYKEEPDVDYEYGHNISFVTKKSSNLCGVTLEIGEEYLIGLSRHNQGYFTVSYCDLVREWSSVSDEDRASLEIGCEDDPCDLTCLKYQECLYYHFGDPGYYYCADVCYPSPCARGEVCTLEDVECASSPCPAIATCTLSSD